MRFVAIDFETANEKRNSACALGITVFQENAVLEEKYWLIRPIENRFESMNVWVHGITSEDVEGEKTFEELWGEIKGYIEGETLVAHNAAFDMSVLRNTLDSYGIPYPQFNYICTLNACKAYYDGVENYKLNTVARALGIKFKHHHAGEDATAAGKVLTQICNDLSIESVEELLKTLSMRIGKVYPGGYSPCGKIKRKTQGLNRKFIQGEIIRSSIDSLKDLNVVFTGALDSLSRAEAIKLVRSAGGMSAGSVSKKTRYLVINDRIKNNISNYRKSTKYRRAEKLKAEGQNIDIISESEFLDIIKN